MSDEQSELPRFSVSEMAKLRSWAAVCLKQWEGALRTYEEAGVLPDNPLFSAVISHYKGSCAGLRYLLWIIDDQKPQRGRRKRKETNGSH